LQRDICQEWSVRDYGKYPYPWKIEHGIHKAVDLMDSNIIVILVREQPD
jgi:hypothetical protein